MESNYHAHARMASVVAALAERLERLARERDVKTVAQIVGEYRDALIRISFDALLGNSDKADLRRHMKALIKTLAMQAYIEGLREGGITEPEGEMDDDDNKAVAVWIAGQLPHVNDYATFVTGLENTDDSRRAMLSRIEIWASSLDSLGRQGEMAARKNQMLTWRLGATEKHCSTCRWLNGKRRRAKWFAKNHYVPQQNGSETLECGGWQCQCGLYDDTGARVIP